MPKVVPFFFFYVTFCPSALIVNQQFTGVQAYNLIRPYINFSYRFLKKYFNGRSFTMLDVGAGNQSATKTTETFPRCKYYGLDISREYNYQPSDFARMQDFYEIDLVKLDYTPVPDNFFDAVWMVHVIEHLPNGEEVLQKLIEKMKPGGIFYLEYPGKKSTTLPSMYGTLNFYDDPSHVRLYNLPELRKVFENNGCTVLRSGTRRNWFYIAALPIRVLGKVLTRKRIEGNLFWDIAGFAEYVLAQKR